MNTLATVNDSNIALNDIAQRYLKSSVSDNTRRAYRSDIVIFKEWCESQNICPLPAPPNAVAAFIASQADIGIKPATLNRRIAAIKYLHESAGYESPTHHKGIAATLAGIKRVKGSKQAQKRAATIDIMHALLAQININTLRGKRDKALLLLGFAGALRRSELAALTTSDIEFKPEGLTITIQHSKTDQVGEGQNIAIYSKKLDITNALQQWLKSSGIKEGALFRRITRENRIGHKALSDKAIALIIKNYAILAGLNPNEFAGHSLRSGFITSAAESGANLFKIMDVSRHKNVETVRRYVRSADMFKDHAGGEFL